MITKSKVFIYDRREMAVLLLLALVVAVFSFTLGVHLGKRVGLKTDLSAPKDTALSATEADKIPNRQELTEQLRGAPQAADETLTQALHDEVTKTGVKLEVPRQNELPNQAKSQNAGATTGEKGKSEVPAVSTIVPPRRIERHEDEELAKAAPDGKYTLQVGSFPSFEEARDLLDALEALELKPYVRAVDLKKKGKWYRVYLGGYGTKDEAEDAGLRFRARKAIDSYVVSNREP